MWVMAEVYEQDLAYVKVGDAAKVTVNAWPSQPLDGKVTFIYPAIGKESRTARLRVEVSNPDGRLRADMEVRLVLQLVALARKRGAAGSAEAARGSG